MCNMFTVLHPYRANNQLSASLYVNLQDCHLNIYLIQNSQAVKKCAALKKAMVKKDVKSKVAAKKWL